MSSSSTDHVKSTLRPFRPYEKITNFHPDFLDTWESNDIKRKVEWYATEKIHGCNFAFHVEKINGFINVRAARRSDFLVQNENFHQYQKVLETYKKALEEMFDQCCHQDFILFGELFGGTYPGMKGELKRPIQKEIYYSPRVEFLAFDLFLHEDETYINHSELMEICKQVNIPVVPILIQGTLHEIVKVIDVEKLSSWHPVDVTKPIPKSIAEGVILKPVSTSVKSNGKRIIYKWKSKAFTDIKCKKLPKQVDPLTITINQTISQVTDEFIQIQADLLTEDQLNKKVCLYEAVLSGTERRPGEVWTKLPESQREQAENIISQRIKSKVDRWLTEYTIRKIKKVEYDDRKREEYDDIDLFASVLAEMKASVTFHRIESLAARCTDEELLKDWRHLIRIVLNDIREDHKNEWTQLSNEDQIRLHILVASEVRHKVANYFLSGCWKGLEVTLVDDPRLDCCNEDENEVEQFEQQRKFYGILNDLQSFQRESTENPSRIDEEKKEKKEEEKEKKDDGVN